MSSKWRVESIVVFIIVLTLPLTGADISPSVPVAGDVAGTQTRRTAMTLGAGQDSPGLAEQDETSSGRATDPSAGHHDSEVVPVAAPPAGRAAPFEFGSHDVDQAEEPMTAISGQSAKVSVQLEVVEKQVTVLGVPFTAWTFNGVLPGPVIRISEGTTLEIVLVNGHSQPHSIHTHLRGNLIASDGSSDTVPFPVVPHQHNILPVDQNPIGPSQPREDSDVARPGESYTYTFQADTPGTFLYHCHVFLATEHISRGLYGIIEVYPAGWTWTELPKDPLNGNTKARVTDDRGRAYFEDVVMMSEITPGGGPGAPATPPPEAPWAPTGVPTSGMTPPGTGKIHIANFRAWNDPYVVGPVRPNEKVRIVLANIGDEYHDWHVHSHWFDVLDKISRDKKPLYTTDALVTGPGDSFETLLTAGAPGYWFMHDHNVPEAHTGMVPWLHVEGEPLPDNAPEVTIDTPIDGAVAAGRILFKGEADDFDGRETVRAVEVRIDDGPWERVKGLTGWRYEWDSTLVADGVHVFSARAYDGIAYSQEKVMGLTIVNSLLGPEAVENAIATQERADELHAAAKTPGLDPLIVAATVALAGLLVSRRSRIG
ncbi:MAG: multicopper oxidase domain-containing protein [Euryarchaeota archaeon]|nr:multicopper oxidase domain-containing protein [Euryarchaeota archaeon]